MGELFSAYDIPGAFWMTLKLAVLSAAGSLVLGSVIAVCRLSPVPLLRWLGTAYITVFRNTPLTLLCVFCMLGLSSNLRIEIADPASSAYFSDRSFRWGLVALIAYHATYVCEALRTGFNAIPPGQAEAARSIGLTFTQSLRHVILPQGFRSAIVPLGNALIALTKNTTVVAAIGVAEIAYLMGNMFENRPDLSAWIFLIVAAGFVLFTLPAGLLTTHLGGKLAVRR